MKQNALETWMKRETPASAEGLDEGAAEVAAEMSAAEGSGAEGGEDGVGAADGLGHLAYVVEVAAEDAEAGMGAERSGAVAGDLFRSAGEGGDLVALIKGHGERSLPMPPVAPRTVSRMVEVSLAIKVGVSGVW